MCETTIDVDGGQMYYRHNDFDASRPTVLFIHGIGESGLCFLEAFDASLLGDFNIIVPDLLGFGRSPPSADHDYTFSKQIARMRALLDGLGVDEFNLVGHSMGGIIGTLFCHHHGDQVLSFVNIEGDLTSDARFITEPAMQSEADGRFEEWLRDDFAQHQITNLCHQWPSTVRYLASLNMCQSSAFLACVHEIYALMESLPDSNLALIGKTYLELNTPRVFCWGTESLSDGAQVFLTDSNLEHKAFCGSFHWVMLDQTIQFYSFLSEFLTTQKEAALIGSFPDS
jgi:pimeloyl-ACP methyl ester carboxylesterase